MDTGSDDGTAERLTELGAEVRQADVTPWRFDVARNMSLELVPEDVDVCVSLDLDEVLAPGWREALEAAWRPETTRGRYLYIWSHDAAGGDGVTFYADKVHARHGYHWRHPVHEILEPDKAELQVLIPGLRIDHWPDGTKSRASYLPLLELAVREDPDGDRNMHYLGRGVYVSRPLGRRDADAYAALGSAYGDVGGGAGRQHALYSAVLSDAWRRPQHRALAGAGG